MCIHYVRKAADAVGNVLGLNQQPTPAVIPTTPQSPPPPPPPPVDNTQAATQAADGTFSSTFTPGFYSQRTAAYNAHYAPEIASQYNTALDQLRTGLVSRGLDGSDIGRAFTTKLDAARAAALDRINTSAITDSNNLGQSVAAAQKSLDSGINPQSDVNATRTAAQNAVAGLNKGPNYTPLGDLFGSILSPITGAAGGQPYSAASSGFTGAPSINLAGSPGARVVS